MSGRRRHPWLVLGLVTAVVTIALLTWTTLLANRSSPPSPTTDPPSPYAGEELRSIKSLSAEDVNALEAGVGEALGGLAKLAELNGYPGPRHVLESAGELGLTPEQKEAVERIYRDMNQRSMALGRQLVQHERELDAAFAQGQINHESLERGLAESALVYGELRNAHLQAHLNTKDVLTADQVRHYNQLRGYGAGQDPCHNVPPGHDPAMWRAHNGCPPAS